VHVDAPDLMEGQLRATVETLERSMQTNPAARPARAPRFTVIDGGLSAAR
jgi:hypothetical protein